MEVLEIVNFTVMQMPQEISELNPEVPEDLALVIKTMIAKNKRERVQVPFFFSSPPLLLHPPLNYF
jgi:hypothetical protein